MIQRVAAAMWDRTHDGRWDDWGDGQDESRIIHRDDARVAIEAMREPTEAMVDAAWASWEDVDGSKGFVGVWQAMIDAALGDKP
jgi:hypothetical protein